MAEKGSRQEALLGCDFVLRMDPLFEPARRLQERLEAASGPLGSEDLRRVEAPAAAAHDVLWGDLDGLASELPELPDPHAAPGSGALRTEFESLLSERRFQELQMRAREESAAVTADLELQRLEKLAQERLEAGPYVSKFLLSAREAMRAGNTVDGNRLLDKARTLDPTHPGIAELSPPAGAATPALDTAAGRGSSGSSGAAAALAPGAAAPALVPAAPAAPAAGGAQPASALTSPATPTPPTSSFPTAQPSNADSESERRIRQLLDEGQAALDGGDPQAAIDAWSRIFLIDIDHQEAAHRIDRARRLKAERDRQVEETFHDGMSRLEASDAGGAREAFQRVIELQPGHLQAREYLQQLDEGNVPAVAGRTGAARPLASLTGLTPLARPAALDPAAADGTTAGKASAASAASTADGAPLPPLPAGLAPGGGASDLAADHDLQEEILVPPDVSEAARPQDSRREVRSASAAPGGRARRLFMVVGSAVLLLALAVGWFLYQKREQWFPNSRTEEPAPAPAPNPIPRATKMHNSGKTAIALAQLSRVPPSDPHYKEAQALIAKWQAEQVQAGPGAAGASGSAAGPQAGGPGGGGGVAGTGGAPGVPTGAAGAAGAAGSDAERRQALIEGARQAYKENAFLLAAQRYGAADRLGKLEAGDAAQLGDAKQKLLPLQRQVDLFLTHEWEFALPDLWKARQSDPGNRDVTRMIVDSYYDLGVRDLQHNEVAKAEQKFTEAKNLAPDDPEVKRQLVFAQTYLARGPDLLYQIYVKYLPIR